MSSPSSTAKRYEVAQLDEVDPVRCPCGFARRAFGGVASMHIVDIEEDAKTHYHKKMHEMYFVLEGEGFIELDGEKIPVKPNSAIFIKPGCRHRAIGKMRIVNVPVPAFDPEDEWFD